MLLEEHKHSFRKMIDGIKEVLPLKSDNFINAEYLDCIPGVKLDENDFDEVSFSVNTKGIDLRKIDVFLKEADSAEKYSFKLTEWEESLGYLVPEYLVQEFGLETLMAAILYEMTWFGTSAEEIHEQICKTFEEYEGENNENINT